MKRLFAVMMAIMVALAATACGGNASSNEGTETGDGSAVQEGAAAANPKVVRWADTGSTASFEELRSPGATSIVRFGEKLEEISGGQMVLKLFPDGQLARSNDEIFTALRTGAFDCASMSAGNWSEQTDAFYYLNVPFLFSTSQQVWDLLDGPIGQASYEKAHADTGIYVLNMMDMGFRQVTSNKPIHSAADMKGLKIRTQTDDIQVAAFEALGCAVTPLSFGELFSALQQGLVEAQENPFNNIVSSKFYEVQKYVTLTNHSYTVSAFAFSPVFIDSLTEQELAWVKEAVDYGAQCGREKVLTMNEEYMGELIEKGMEIIEPTPEELQTFVEGVTPAWDKVRELMGEEQFNAVVEAVNASGAA